MTKPNDHSSSAEYVASRLDWLPWACMAAAAACLIGVTAICSGSLLRGDPLYGIYEPSHVLAARSARLAWALAVAAVVAWLAGKALRAGADGRQKAAAAALLAAPVVATAVCYATSNEWLLGRLPLWWAEMASCPLLATLLADAFLAGGRPGAKGIALYWALSVAYCAFVIGVDCWHCQHDYVESFFMAVVFIGAFFVSLRVWDGIGRGRAAAALAVAVLAAACLSILADWRFWDILGEPGYAAVWLSDRMESIQRFLAPGIGVEGWDCVPERNAFFAISQTSGGPVAAAYAALAIASAALMGIACCKLARCRWADAPVQALAVSACGIAYTACVVLGLGSELLNISTGVGITQAMGTVPAAIMLMAAVLGRCPFEEIKS
ncbi:MAG: hypothetical protein IJ111_13035 [Eggerthellaceae bacterium]|nr:hypothetical protein [Eggerthellaceae bacterium]